MSEIKEVNSDYKKIQENNEKIKKYDNYGFVAAVGTFGSIVSGIFAPEHAQNLTAVGMVGGLSAMTAIAIAKTRLKIKDKKQKASFVIKHGDKNDAKIMKQLNNEHSKNWKKVTFNVGASATTAMAILYTAPLVSDFKITPAIGLLIGISCGVIASFKNSNPSLKIRKINQEQNKILDKTIAERVFDVATNEVAKTKEIFEKTNALVNKSTFKGPK